MGVSSSYPDQIHIIDRVNVVKGQIHRLVAKWAQEWLHYIEDPTEFDRVCGGSFHTITHQIAFGLGKNSIKSNSLIETAVKGHVLTAIDFQMRQHDVRYDRSAPFSHLYVNFIYNRDLGTVTYIITCRVKKD